MLIKSCVHHRTAATTELEILRQPQALGNGFDACTQPFAGSMQMLDHGLSLVDFHHFDCGAQARAFRTVSGREQQYTLGIGVV